MVIGGYEKPQPAFHAEPVSLPSTPHRRPVSRCGAVQPFSPKNQTCTTSFSLRMPLDITCFCHIFLHTRGVYLCSACLPPRNLQRVLVEHLLLQMHRAIPYRQVPRTIGPYPDLALVYSRTSPTQRGPARVKQVGLADGPYGRLNLPLLCAQGSASYQTSADCLSSSSRAKERVRRTSSSTATKRRYSDRQRLGLGIRPGLPLALSDQVR